MIPATKRGRALFLLLFIGLSLGVFHALASARIIHSEIGRICVGPTAQGVPIGSPLPSPLRPFGLGSQVGIVVSARGCHSTSERFVEVPTIRWGGHHLWLIEGKFTSELPAGPILPDCGNGVVSRVIGNLTVGHYELRGNGLAITFDVPADGSPVSAPAPTQMPDGWRCAEKK